MKHPLAFAMLLLPAVACAGSQEKASVLDKDVRPDHPQLVQRGELPPDDPIYVQLLGEPTPAGVARPLRFEQSMPFELPPPSTEQWQRHRQNGGMLMPEDPRPPRGVGKVGATRVNLVYCGWVLHQGASVAGDLAFLYEFRRDADGEGRWHPSGMEWRRLEAEELQSCRQGAAAP